MLRRNLTGWLYISPLVAGIVLFQIYPILVSLYASLTSWDGIGVPRFIGVLNYKKMAADPLFWRTLRNTASFMVGAIPLTIVGSLALAVLCTRKDLKVAPLFRAAYFTPFVTSVVAISLVWFQFYAPERGVINRVLAVVGIEGPAWLSDSTWAMPAVILVAAWQGVGYPMVILIAGLQGIPTTLYEAATVDGASGWGRFYKITLPLLSPSLFFVLLTQIITSFQVFGIIFVMTSGGPANATNVIIYYLYQNAFAFGRLGYASAMAWSLFLMVAIFAFIQWRLQKKWVFYE